MRFLLSLIGLALVAGLTAAPPLQEDQPRPMPKLGGPLPMLQDDDQENRPPGILPGEEVPLKVMTPNQITTNQIPWHVEKLAAPQAWAVTRGKGVRVAVLDTGIDGTHPDLFGQIASAVDFTGAASGPADVQGHGTHCAGIVAGASKGQGSIGVAPECQLLSIKVLGDNGSGANTWITKGIAFAAQSNVDVISMSLGGPSPTSDVRDACAKAVAAGVIVIAAAGNAGPAEGTIGYPGGYAEVLAVGATDTADQAARFSSRGKNVFVAAPGVAIWSTFPGSRYAALSGTSMACPSIAGLAALWVASHPDVPKVDRPAKFRAALQAACRDLGTPGRDTTYGFGLPSAYTLVRDSAKPPEPGRPFLLTEGDLSPEALARWRSSFPGGKLRLELPTLCGPDMPKENP